MASPPFVTPVYHDPSPGRTRTRRSSSRRSFASPLARADSNQDALRSPLLQDVGACSFDAEHLKAWYLSDDELWRRLPANLRSHLAFMQHAGAAVLAGFARLDKHAQVFHEHDPESSRIPLDNLPDHLDNLPSPRFRTMSNNGSLFAFGIPTPPSAGSPSAASNHEMESTSLTQALKTYSPLALSPSVEEPHDHRSVSSSGRSFSVPLEPQDAYYTVELSHLRTEALPRLRHAGIKVDMDWTEAKNAGLVVPEDMEAFETWWKQQKQIIASLDEQGKRLASAIGLNSTGVGWTAP